MIVKCMRIFLTGGTGYIGSAVLDAFVRAGHHVDALVRNSEKAARSRRAARIPCSVMLGEPASYADAAAAADGVVHDRVRATRRAARRSTRRRIDTILAVRRQPRARSSSTHRASGCSALPRRRRTKRAALNPIELSAWRPAHETRVLDAATAGWRTIVVRPGIVYGGVRGIVGDVLKDAANSLVRVIGSGDNHWPLIYDRDLADLYVRSATNPEASGVYHANDEGDETRQRHRRGHQRAREDDAERAARAARRGEEEDGAVRRRAGARSDRPQPARPRAGLDSRRCIRSSGNAARLFEEWRAEAKRAVALSSFSGARCPALNTIIASRDSRPLDGGFLRVPSCRSADRA